MKFLGMKAPKGRKSMFGVITATVLVLGLVACVQDTADSSALVAQLPKDCVPKNGQPDSCTPLVACFSTGEVMIGSATGWLKGRLSGQTETGLSCSGDWQVQNTRGNYGSANLKCSDGRSGIATFGYADFATHSVWGDGTLSDGTEFRAWTGPNLARFVGKKKSGIQAFCAQSS